MPDGNHQSKSKKQICLGSEVSETHNSHDPNPQSFGFPMFSPRRIARCLCDAASDPSDATCVAPPTWLSCAPWPMGQRNPKNHQCGMVEALQIMGCLPSTGAGFLHPQQVGEFHGLSRIHEGYKPTYLGGYGLWMVYGTRRYTEGGL